MRSNHTSPSGNPPPVGAMSTHTFTALASTAVVSNSGRGQCEWLSQPGDPTSIPILDVYQRPDAAWKTIETSQGVYNWAILDTALAHAASLGGRLSWRVMPMRSWGDGVSWPSYVPTLIRSGTSYPYPNWNSATFVTGWCNMVAAMGARYDSDPRLYAVDLSAYAMYGEHIWDTSYGPAMTTANMQTIMQATKAAFPHTFVIMPACGLNSPAQALAPTIFGAGSRTWGHRYDNFGGVNVADVVDYSGISGWADQWKYGPVFLEWVENYGDGNTTVDAAWKNLTKLHGAIISSTRLTDVRYAGLSGADQVTFMKIQNQAGFRLSLVSVALPDSWAAGQTITVTTTWSNAGQAPTHDPWKVQLITGGQVVTLVDDLRTVLPGTAAFTSTVTAPANRDGLAIKVVDPAGYLAPMKLAITGQLADGSCPIA